MRSFLSARSTAIALLALVAMSTACSDASRVSSPNVAEAPRLDALAVPTVEAQIEAIFPKGLRSAALARWGNVKRQYGDGSDAAGVSRARTQMFLLVDWIIRQQPKLGVSPLAALSVTASVSPPVAQLISSMYAYVFPNAPQPPANLAGDAVVGVVMPNAPATIVTPAKLAGVDFPEGSVSEPMILVIHEKPGATALYAAACSGPLPTTLCQYPMFYEFHPYPYQTLLTPARAGVCVATSGPRAPAASVKPRLRLAHQTPAPSAVIGTVYEGIELLPHADVDDFLECDDVAFTPPVLASIENPAVRGGLRLLALAGERAWDAFAPRTLHAYDRGGGGEVMAFSDFDAVDMLPPTPPPMPDLAITSPFSFGRGLTSLSADTFVIEDDTLNVAAYDVGNVGTASAITSTLGLFLSTDSTITASDTPIGYQTTTGWIAAGATWAMPSQLIFMPTTLTHGVRWLGPLADVSDTITEASETNNFTSRKTVLVYPNIGFEKYPGGATSCTPSCPLTNQYSSRAVTFSFEPLAGSPTAARLEHTGEGFASNREATAPQSFIAVINGHFVMTFAPDVRHLRFQVRVPLPATAPSVSATDNASNPLTPTSVLVTSGLTSATYTYFYSAPAGIANAKVQMSSGASNSVFVDNVLVRP